jgi:hypothetical protein
MACSLLANALHGMPLSSKPIRAALRIIRRALRLTTWSRLPTGPGEERPPIRTCDTW